MAIHVPLPFTSKRTHFCYCALRLKAAMMLLVANDGPWGLSGLTILSWGIGPTIASVTLAVTSC